jgi:hypothetical protein
MGPGFGVLTCPNSGLTPERMTSVTSCGADEVDNAARHRSSLASPSRTGRASADNSNYWGSRSRNASSSGIKAPGSLLLQGYLHGSSRSPWPNALVGATGPEDAADCAASVLGDTDAIHTAALALRGGLPGPEAVLRIELTTTAREWVICRLVRLPAQCPTLDAKASRRRQGASVGHRKHRPRPTALR